MDEVVEFSCPSGALLRFRHPPYADADALLRAVMAECTRIPVHSQDELFNLAKTHLCVAFSSELVQKTLWKVMGASTYSDSRGDLKIDRSTFEPVASREDYPVVAMEVLQATLGPFGKSLLLVLNRLTEYLGQNQK